MNNIEKFEILKQSLTSLGKNTRLLQTKSNSTNYLPTTTRKQIPFQNSSNISQNSQNELSRILLRQNFKKSDGAKHFNDNQQNIQTYQNYKFPMNNQIGIPGSVIYSPRRSNNKIQDTPSSNPQTTNQQNIFNNTFNKNNQNTFQHTPLQNITDIFNPKYSTMNKGAIRSAIKFDYKLGQLNNKNKISLNQKPTMNIFSCMDHPNYQRQFQVSPKFMRK